MVRVNMQLDEFDLRILDIWQSRGDVGPVEMASDINLSASQCSRRMQALRASGIVKAISAQLDAQSLAIGIAAYVLVTMKSHSPDAAAAFKERVLALDEIQECQTLTGEADVILKVVTRDLASFNALLTGQLLSAPEVATARSSLILENVKSTTRRTELTGYPRTTSASIAGMAGSSIAAAKHRALIRNELS